MTTTYSAEQLYFGPLQMQARSPVFLAKWQRALRLKQKVLAGLEQSEQGALHGKQQHIARQVQWIRELLG